MVAISRVDSGEFGVSVAIYGLAELERTLKSMAPDLRKQMDKGIRDGLRPTLTAARARIPSNPPLSGWSTTGAASGRTRGGVGWPAWDPRGGRAGISVRRGSPWGRRRTTVAVAWRIESRDASATIFDKAVSGHSPQWQNFVAVLTERFGKSQRVLWPAWLATREAAMTSVENAVRDAEAALQSRVDAIDGRAA